MFRTNTCSSLGGYFCTRSMLYFAMNLWSVLAATHPIDAWKNTTCCVYKNSLLVMNKYLFETCRGYCIVSFG
jgi:hypothetical protein